MPTFRSCVDAGRRLVDVTVVAAILLAVNIPGANAQLNVTWAKNFGTSGQNTQINATAVDSAGNVYVAGTFFGSLSVGGMGLTGQSYSTDPMVSAATFPDIFVAKLDSSGAAVWAKNFGSFGPTPNPNIAVASIAVDGSGNTYLTGRFQGADLYSPALTRIGSSDVYAIKMDSTGSVVWAKNFGGAGAAAYGNAIAVDGSGNVYLGGKFGSANLTTPALTSIGANDPFAIKLNSSGVLVWAMNFGGAGASAGGNAIAVDGAGNIYLGGNFNGGNFTTPPLTRISNPGFPIKYDSFAIALDSSGTIIWAKNFGAAGASAESTAIAVDGSGNAYLVGYLKFANLTTPTLTRIGNIDAFVVKLDSSGATSAAGNFGGIGAQVTANSIAVDGSGNVYLGGVFSVNNLTEPSLTKIGAQDAFLIKASTQSTLVVTLAGAGSGSVTSSPSGISCGSTCSAIFTNGASVTLTAAAASGSTFSGWSGDCSGSSAAATISMTTARACTATFAVTVTSGGGGGGTTTGTPPPWLGPSGNGQLNFSSVEVTIDPSGRLSVSIPSGYFNASDLTFTAMLVDGSALPSWLTFNSTTLSFFGTPPSVDAVRGTRAARHPVRAADVSSSTGRWLATAPLRIAVRLSITLQVRDRQGRSAAVTFPFAVYAMRSPAAVVAVSVTDTGTSGNGVSTTPALSDDGSALAFQSVSTNLLGADVNAFPDVIRYDVASGLLARFSTGNFMGTIAGPANGWSGAAAISADARAIAFASDAPNVGLPWGNGIRQVWVADASRARISTITPSPTAASATADGTLADGASDSPSLSEDGQYVAFESEATNLVSGAASAVRRVYRKDRTSGAIVLVAAGRRPSTSADGRYIAYDDGERLWRKDLTTDAVLQVGAGTAARLNRDGSKVAYQSGGRVLWKDLNSGTLQTAATDGSAPTMSGDGRFVAFVSLGQVWVCDVSAGTTALVSTTTDGSAGNAASTDPAISGDGRFIAFASQATDLVSGQSAGQMYLAGNPLLAPLASGWWWSPAAPGAGFAVETSGDRLMFGGFLYASDGSPVWYLGQGNLSTTKWSGSLQLYQGGQTLAGSYRAPTSLGSVGAADIVVASRSAGTLSGAHVAGLQRFEFSSGGLTAGPQLGSPESGWWWNPDEPGTGWYLEIQNASAFVAGFLYDDRGQASWVSASGPMSSTRSFTGTLVRCAGGQTLGGAYQPATCSGDQGTVAVSFSSPVAATMTLPSGRQVTIKRFRF